jgi:hypothetical protein
VLKVASPVPLTPVLRLLNDFCESISTSSTSSSTYELFLSHSPSIPFISIIANESTIPTPFPSL